MHYQIKEVKSHAAFYNACFIILGFTVNSVYVLSATAVQDVSNDFDKMDYLPLYTGITFVPSFIVKVFVASWLLVWSHFTRIWIAAIMMVMGMVLLAFAYLWEKEFTGFVISLIGMAFIGMSSAMGEITLLGFIKSSPSLLKAVGAGMGICALIPSLYFVVMRLNDVPVPFVLV